MNAPPGTTPGLEGKPSRELSSNVILPAVTGLLADAVIASHFMGIARRPAGLRPATIALGSPLRGDHRVFPTAAACAQPLRIGGHEATEGATGEHQREEEELVGDPRRGLLHRQFGPGVIPRLLLGGHVQVLLNVGSQGAKHSLSQKQPRSTKWGPDLSSGEPSLCFRVSGAFMILESWKVLNIQVFAAEGAWE